MTLEDKTGFFNSFPFKNAVHFPKNAKVFITGGTGFIGGRLAEVLIKNFQAEVFLLVRNFGKAIPLSKYPVNYIWGSLENNDWFDKVPVDIEFVFHCAYGNKGNPGIRRLTDVEGTSNILDFCKSRDPKRLIFLSTQSVYDVVLSGMVNENSTKKPVDAYGKNKLAAENLINEKGKKENIPFVIIQPTAVIGPGAPSYVIRPIKEITQYTVVFLNEGNGILNWIYVDDLVCGMLQCCVNEAAVGKTFLLTSDDPVTYFDYYARLAAVTDLSYSYKKITGEENKRLNRKESLISIVKSSVVIDRKKARRLLNYGSVQFAYKLFKWLRPSQKQGQAITSAQSEKPAKPISGIDQQYAKFISSQAVVNSQMAKSVIEFSPAYKLEDCLEKIAGWYKWKFHYAGKKQHSS